MKSIESIDKTAKSIGAFDSINYGVYCEPVKADELIEMLIGDQWPETSETYRAYIKRGCTLAPPGERD